jgi:hypothetical protein
VEANLSSRIHNYKLTEGSFIEALDHVAREFKIPMGVEWVASSSARAQFSMFWDDASILEIIQDIAKRQDGYSVAVKNGVVHITCGSLVRPSQNPGLIKIKALAISKTSLGWASKQLRDQVKLTVSPPDSSDKSGGPRGSGGSFISSTDEPTVSLDVHNVTAEDALDKLIVGAGEYIWVITFSEDSKLTPTGFRRTISLWNNLHIEDNQQPLWDLFAWKSQLPKAIVGVN